MNTRGHNNPTYQFTKIDKVTNEKTVILETEAASIENALDYFYIMVPKSYGNPNYTIGIKQNNFNRDTAQEWN